MDTKARVSLQGLRVVSFESRRAKEMMELIRRYGGEPVAAPALREVSLDRNDAVLDLLPQLEAARVDVVILMTGIGTRTLNQVLLTKYPQQRITAALTRTTIVARGPKPIGALKEIGVQPLLTAPEPNTWREVLAALTAAVPVRGKRIVIQEYGIPSKDLIAALDALGAVVLCLPIYRWALPDDVAPLQQAIEELLRGEAEVALFTNGAQVDHLFKVAGGVQAQQSLREALRAVVVGSVGPVCTEVLEQFAVTPDIEPAHPKMGSLIAQVAAAAHTLLAAKRAAARS
jgi:uroporphyrinogen-III synthase